ncbi:hypothetical protein BDQ17DRAFT_1550705 [Cyathus striatus]|nr:hypothetical protein BDQ17DRAFT_1550705 [Cyathus striatus]
MSQFQNTANSSASIDARLPPYPSATIDYANLSESQFRERVKTAFRFPDVTTVQHFIEAMGDQAPYARQRLEEHEHQEANRSGNSLSLIREPRAGEDVHFYQLKENVSIRVWRGDLAQLQAFSMGFVLSNDLTRTTRKPANIRLFARELGEEITSIEYGLSEALRLNPSLRQFEMYLPSGVEVQERETFFVPEVFTVDVFQGEYPKVTVILPRTVPENYAPRTTRRM